MQDTMHAQEPTALVHKQVTHTVSTIVLPFIAVNPPLVATDLRGTHDTSLGALSPLYSVESAHL